ncbi:MAG TPA: glycosyltransferase [Sedimenticola sp.]|nr:glycosyltransferase [Sedimenticola sp.]
MTRFATRLRRAWSHLRVLGPREFLRFLWRRLFHAPGFGRIDLFEHYAFLEPPGTAAQPNRTIEAKTMVWMVPGFEIGSGGHLNIFRMIANLEELGYRCQICIVGDTRFTSAGEARRVIREHFVPLEADVVIGADRAMAAEFAVATSWITAYSVRHLPDVRHRLYFIQDFEPWFYPHGSDYVFAEQTYRFGFTGITAGDWLGRLVSREYGMPVHVFRFSYDKQRYRPLPRRPGPKRVFFYARNVTPRRGFELGMLALARVHERLPEVEFVLAGWDVSAYRIPFPAHNAGVVPLDQLADLYSQCDCALVISLTNVSLLPLELMACGCPVVSNRGENVEWLLKDRDNALLADADPRALADAVVRLLTDAGLRERIRERGLACAAATDWKAEARGIAAFLSQIGNDA